MKVASAFISNLVAQQLVLVALLVGCGEGTEVGNGLKPGGAGGNDKESAEGDFNETNSPVNDSVDNESPNRPEESGGLGDDNSMAYLVASCGSPLAEIGTAKFTLSDSAFFFSKANEVVTTSTNKEWTVVPSGSNAKIVIAGRDAATLPQDHTCGALSTVSNQSVDGFNDVTKRFLNIQLNSVTAAVSWFSRFDAATNTTVVFKITIEQNDNVNLEFAVSQSVSP